MFNVKKVFIDSNGELNTKGKGRLATLSDLNMDICCGGEPIEGLVEIHEGYYQWQDFTFIDEDDFCGYSKMNNLAEMYLKKAFYEDLDSSEEILSFRVSGKILQCITKMFNPRIIYFYYYFINDKNEVDKNYMYMQKDMLLESGLF